MARIKQTTEELATTENSAGDGDGSEFGVGFACVPITVSVAGYDGRDIPGGSTTIDMMIPEGLLPELHSALARAAMGVNQLVQKELRQEVGETEKSSEDEEDSARGRLPPEDYARVKFMPVPISIAIAGHDRTGSPPESFGIVNLTILKKRLPELHGAVAALAARFGRATQRDLEKVTARAGKRK